MSGPGRAVTALVAALLLARSATAAPAGPAQDWAWLPGSMVDYAPTGMPDFSQCRRGWSRPATQPGRPAQWTFAAPVALADALWWLDSRAEPGRVPPPAVSDGHGLVTFYPVFGRAKDDHDPANLGSLVEDLALRLGTDGRGGTAERRGTAWEGLVGGLRDYLASRRLGEVYGVETRLVPDPAWLRRWTDEGAALVVALGVWERQGEAWRRVGGHYATVAGIAPGDAGASGADALTLALADPLADQVTQTGLGRMVPPEAARHSCRIAPAAHDDAAVIAHDGYALTVDLPDERLILSGYFRLEAMGEAAAFAGQNPLALPAEQLADWQGGAVVMALDAALAIVPAPTLRPPGPTATKTATATATATATPSATAESEATPTLTATAPTMEPSPTPPRGTGTAGEAVDKLFLPRLQATGSGMALSGNARSSLPSIVTSFVRSLSAKATNSQSYAEQSLSRASSSTESESTSNSEPASRRSASACSENACSKVRWPRRK